MAGHAADWEPDGEEAGGEDGGKDQKKICELNANGIGINNKRALAGAKLNQAKTNL